MTILISKGEPEQTEKKHYTGVASATPAEIAEVGGKIDLIVQNCFFQSNIDSQNQAESLLARLKTRKEYMENTSEYCVVPVERRDSIIVQERVTHEKDINHTGLVRGVKLSITPVSQSLTIILEE